MDNERHGEVTLSELDADGIGFAEASLSGVVVLRMECTQAEFNELALEFSGVNVPESITAKARAEQARRVALGRTRVEELVPRHKNTQPEGGAA
ncbi:MAG: hypothetical protein JXQ84_07755 [Rhodospirillaceae bacterium]|nr:hypothetical protein [Rhodospirillaceae bacterium]